MTTASEFDITAEVALGGIYSLPGEGFVVELRFANATHMFDRQGLQHRIIEKKQRGLDASVEETALARINSCSSFGAEYSQW